MENLNNGSLLQYSVANYMDNDGVTMLQAEQKGRPIKSVASRMKGMTGRIRGNLMGMRGDFTCRTIITSDQNIIKQEVQEMRFIIVPEVTFIDL
jgi:DNA-directed RNA polymerase beta' subunit